MMMHVRGAARGSENGRPTGNYYRWMQTDASRVGDDVCLSFIRRRVRRDTETRLPYSCPIIDNARTVCGAGSTRGSGVRLSVRPTIRPGSPPYSTAAGLLLCARLVGDIDRLLHGRRNSSSAAARRLSANASSVAFTAGVGSWTQTCSSSWTFILGKAVQSSCCRKRSRWAGGYMNCIDYV